MAYEPKYQGFNGSVYCLASQYVKFITHSYVARYDKQQGIHNKIKFVFT